MRRRAFTTWQVAILLAGLGILAVALYPVFNRARVVGYRASCQSNLKRIGLAISLYRRDYNETFPRVNAAQRGWMDGIMPYIENPAIFQCPSDQADYVEGSSDYFFNARLSGRNDRKVTHFWNTILSGDGLSNAPTNVSLTKLPLGWKNNPKSPAYRHLEGAFYSYADGHVKWLKPEKVSNDKASWKVSTFAPW